MQLFPMETLLHLHQVTSIVAKNITLRRFCCVLQEFRCPRLVCLHLLPLHQVTLSPLTHSLTVVCMCTHNLKNDISIHVRVLKHWKRACICILIQWNPSNPNTTGPADVHVLISKYTNMVLGGEASVLLREVSLFQGCPYRGAPLYTCMYNAYYYTTGLPGAPPPPPPPPGTYMYLYTIILSCMCMVLYIQVECVLQPVSVCVCALCRWSRSPTPSPSPSIRTKRNW